MSRDPSLIERSAALERSALDLQLCRQDPSPARLAAVIVDLSSTCEHLADVAEGWGHWLTAAVEEAAALRARGLLEADVTAEVERAAAGLLAIETALRDTQRTTAGVPEALTAFGRLTT